MNNKLWEEAYKSKFTHIGEHKDSESKLLKLKEGKLKEEIEKGKLLKKKLKSSMGEAYKQQLSNRERLQNKI